MSKFLRCHVPSEKTSVWRERHNVTGLLEFSFPEEGCLVKRSRISGNRKDLSFEDINTTMAVHMRNRNPATANGKLPVILSPRCHSDYMPTIFTYLK